jgi:hypothetical protein
VEQRLATLRDLVLAIGGTHCRILRSHFASDGAPDLVFEQEVADLATLERQIQSVTGKEEFQSWSRAMSPLLARSPKREVLLVLDDRVDGR